MAIQVMPSVGAATERIQELLRKAQTIKKSSTIDPPLPAAEFSGPNGLYLGEHVGDRSSQYAVIETAARSCLYEFVASRTIDQPSFVEVWNLLDIVQICGDNGQCDGALVLWLVEELLDSQSIDGCRIVFNYLESRRERIIAKDFLKNKNLIVLRSCNELLRRLSRAEDAVFCGRVFIFLFQSFPLGDKSSVNLRGEFHVENVTTFEDTRPESTTHDDVMDVDSKPLESVLSAEKIEKGTSSEVPTVTVNASDTAGSVIHNKDTKDASNKTLDADTLYPRFWALQHAFSNPPLLFSQEYLEGFKSGLETTLAKFMEVPKIIQAKANDSKKGTKRNHTEMRDDFASTFNPKYLTSKDLFILELSDLAFQRNILVQALIVLDFLLSLSERSKERLSGVTQQKALQYPFTLSKEDTAWTLGMKDEIARYLNKVSARDAREREGPIYHRMVDTVLSRDKNWVRWKLENCPGIKQQPASAQEFIDAKTGAERVCATKRLRATPMGSVDLGFLVDSDIANGMDRLKGPDRYSLPEAESFIKGIAGDDLDLEMAVDEKEKESLQEAKVSKTWRTLRIAYKTKLGMFDKIDDGKALQRLFQPEAMEEAVRDEDGNEAAAEGRVNNSVAEQTGQQEEQRADRASETLEARVEAGT
ncbi:nuclear matrix protein [Patellaria atrata CBS 101060]|uniref:Nuclear matrix protein n=1 Tax=Patellaria atrata CBS 101060 TaxID=1346257 RepID=A0A9P4VV34_9PEZI|nr:nuclear matrix protein [Patellaria atrata CBS 101060]